MDAMLAKRDYSDNESSVESIPIGTQTPRMKGMDMLGCLCAKSKCLKLYCACFAKGIYCSEYCKCSDCHNLPGNPLLKRKIREKNKNSVIFKHEAIYTENIDFGSNGGEDIPLSCKCSRSQCVKAYCECFALGRYCTDFCKCINCLNRPDKETNNKKQDYMRWKNLMKNNERNHRKNVTNKLEYVFMPAGSLYSLMISKMNHQNENFLDEDCQGLMKKLKQQVSLDDSDKISNIYSKIPSVFHQHHYISGNDTSTPKKISNFLSSPLDIHSLNEEDMIKTYTKQSSSTQKRNNSQQSEEQESNPIYYTPVKNNKNYNSSVLSTTLPTPINLPQDPNQINKNQVHDGLCDDGQLLNRNFKKERKLMIVDEWALNTETEIKKSIIVSEFFKMVLEDENIGIMQDSELINNENRGGASSSYNHMSAPEKCDIYSSRSVLSRSTKSPIKRNYLHLDQFV